MVTHFAMCPTVNIPSPLRRKCPQSSGYYSGSGGRPYQRTAQERVTGNQLCGRCPPSQSPKIESGDSPCASARLFHEKQFSAFKMSQTLEEQRSGHGGARSGAGRPAGVPNKVNMVTRDRIEREADPVGFFIKLAAGEAIEAAVPVGPDRDHTEKVKIYPTLEQRSQAQRVLINKLLPDAKVAPITLTLPEVKTADDVLAAHAAVVAAVASGQIAPDVAEILSGILENRRKAIETVEFERRIAVLEETKK
jgi:hypothetical protein